MFFSDFNDIHTKRLTLSLIKYEDVDVIYDLRSNSEVQKYIQREPYTKRVEAEDQVNKVLALLVTQEAITWTINLKSESIKIGTVCFWNLSKDKKTAEVGYDLLPEFHNKGFMSEVLKTVLDFGFKTLQFKVIEAYTNKYNKASIALLEKNDFSKLTDRVDNDCPDNMIFCLKRTD